MAEDFFALYQCLCFGISFILLLFRNAWDGWNKQLTAAFPFVFIYWKRSAETQKMEFPKL